MMDFTLDPSNITAEKAPHLKAQIQQFYLCDEQDYVQELLDVFPETNHEELNTGVENLILAIRQQNSQSILHQLLQEYDLSTDEGITLMCLAEALIRIPDLATANDLLIDKLSERGWQHHLNKSESFWVNAASWGLAISGKMLKPNKPHPSEAIKGLVNKLTLKITHDAVIHAIKIMGEQFIFSQSIDEAIEKAKPLEQKRQCCSFDMLGEQALSEEDASRYYEAYSRAIDVVARGNKHKKQLTDNISIKLSALHPRYEPSHQHRSTPIIIDRLLKLAKKAKSLNVPITIDAEEQYRLEISLEIFETVFSHQDLANWGDFGLVVQAYGKRALSILHWLYALASKTQTQIPVRLVKGAYWDSEIKWAQQQGLEEYPVFTQKASTDLNYMACVQFLLKSQQQWLKPKFATHNAWTVEFIIQQRSNIDFEFQRLQGMGEALYDQILDKYGIPCRIYSPIGIHQELLPYLVRRLIENGANSSFVFQVHDPQMSMHHLTQHPAEQLLKSSIMNPNVPLPGEIFVDYRNSLGIELEHEHFYHRTMDSVLPYFEEHYETCTILNGEELKSGTIIDIKSPIDGKKLGEFFPADETIINTCCDYLAKHPFNPPEIETLTQQVERIADELHNHRHELIFLCMQEAGKTLKNAVDEVREAIDFCRYYARQAQKNFADPTILDSVTGEENILQYRPRGTVLCISPWNFPLAIFMGQIVAALACGNRVVAKPARQTSITAHRAVELIFKAGISQEQLILIPGKGGEITEPLIKRHLIDMVCFTGSTPSAKQIQQWLLTYCEKFIPFLAETGGQNVMFADSTSLIDQLVPDVITSAFDNAGQRCSALRVLYIQKDIKDSFYTALKGRMKVLNLESPFLRDTDIGPIIDNHEKSKLEKHIEWLNENGKFIAKVESDHILPSENFLAPCVYEIDDINQLTKEHFGPILHVIPFDHDDLDSIIQQVNSNGYGLTLGVHSRNQRWIDYICAKAIVGNIYINRNMIGAKVGSQPFGGHGLSGTGPKAGGPNYVHAFVKEFTMTTNTAAFGGNQELLS